MPNNVLSYHNSTVKHCKAERGYENSFWWEHLYCEIRGTVAGFSFFTTRRLRMRSEGVNIYPVHI